MHIFWVDERCVPPTDDASNYKLARIHLIEPAHIPDANIHRILGELDPSEAASRYVAEIRGFFHLEAAGPPRFDVMHRGMGRTRTPPASSPASPLIDDRVHIAAAVFAPQFNQWRSRCSPPSSKPPATPSSW